VGHKIGYSFQGVAYVFTMPPGGWTSALPQSAELSAADAAEGDRLGYSVAISGTTIVAGAPLHKVRASAGQGAAYVFAMPPGGWTSTIPQSAELTASDGSEEDRFGSSVANSGNTIVVGGPYHKLGSNAFQGAAYVFTMPAGGWTSTTQTIELSAAGGASSDKLGSTVAISNEAIVAGAPFHPSTYLLENVTHLREGIAYVFTPPAPSVAIMAPANGATYQQGQFVRAAYSCGAAQGTSLSACDGPVANGAAIDTATPGAHTFTVTATDNLGASSPRSVSYTVLGTPTLALAAPVLTALRESFKRWRNGSRLARISAKKPAKAPKPPVGTTFSFNLNTAATVGFTFIEKATGRRIKGRCSAQTKLNRAMPRCTRATLAGGLAFSAHAGANQVRFAGRISASQRLGPGLYTLVITAVNAGGRSAPQSLSFTILR
jgi:hypothetical protein